MNDALIASIRQTVDEILKNSTSEKNIRKLIKKHEGKKHFIPIKYRVLGGVLQGLNIKFGNFIEKMLSNLVENDPGVESMPDSGKKIKLYFTHTTDALIDTYITSRQLSGHTADCTPEFDRLLAQIIEIEKNADENERQGIVKDVDGLFKTAAGVMVYTELKYNDDHDTGKFADINRKFLKTWAGLAVRYNIETPDQLKPIIYYYNPDIRYGPIHTPARNVMRGEQLFTTYFQTKYEDINKYLAEIGNDPEIVAIFDKLYRDIRD